MHFILFEDLKKNPEKVLKSTCSFLNVDFDRNMLLKNKVSNKSYLPKNMLVRYYFRNFFGSNSIISKIEKKINTTKSPYPNMTKVDHDFLHSYFCKSNLKLQKLTGLDLSQWNI